MGSNLLRNQIRSNQMKPFKTNWNPIKINGEIFCFQLELHHLETKLKHLESDLAVSNDFSYLIDICDAGLVI